MLKIVLGPFALGKIKVYEVSIAYLCNVYKQDIDSKKIRENTTDHMRIIRLTALRHSEIDINQSCRIIRLQAQV